MLFSPRYGVHRYEANYYHVDYDDADYLRFGRVEKQLENSKSFRTHRPKRSGGGFFL